MSSSISVIDNNPHIVQQLRGFIDINPSLIKSQDDYDNIYRVRHDLIHRLVCDKFGVPFGERKVSEVLTAAGLDLSNKQYYHDIKEQTPDYLGIKGNTATMFEVTISSTLSAHKRKASKYALLVYFLRKNGYIVEYKIFVFNPVNIYLNRTQLLSEGLDELVMDTAGEYCKNARTLLTEVHRTVDGLVWYKKFNKIISGEIEFPFFIEDTLKTYEKFDNKCFHSAKDMMDSLEEPHNLVDSDREFIEFCVDQIPNIESTLMSTDSFDTDRFMKVMEEKSNTNDLRSVLPLPFIKLKTMDSSIRSTQDDYDLLQIFSAKMIDSNDSIISNYGQHLSDHLINLEKIKQKTNTIIKNEDLLFKVKFNSQEKAEMAIEGPGRKHYMKQGISEHINASNKFDGYSLNPNVDVSELEELSFFFSNKENLSSSGDVVQDMHALSELSSPGLDYARFCQSVFRELNINSMRGDRRHSHIIKPCGVNGVYILIFKGTKLRCGELVNIIWFKVLVDNESIDESTRWTSHWAFKRLFRDKKISYTKWISTDVHRLDHYIRCFDKILMAYTAMMSSRFKSKLDLEQFKSKKQKKPTSIDLDIESKEDLINPTEFTLNRLISSDNTNALGLIVMTYLEDKRATSKMIQNVRYLVMTCLSLFPRISSVMEKFSEAIRSPLQLYYLKQCLHFIRKMSVWKVSNNCNFGSVKYDHQTHMFLDSHGGSNIRMPRPLITDPSGFSEFSEILSEMYFTMLFNKNQDDPTHASFQVLDKILEGEESFKKVKLDNEHLGYLPELSDIDFAKKVLEKKRTHMFSRRAIMIGAKLLREELDDPTAEHYSESMRHHNMNKTLDQYATFKSSSKFENTNYNDLNNRQNPRVRCIEGVLELQNEGLMRSYDVVQHKKDEETSFHVFKKNQIGGVREILILPIDVRIRINVLETLSRNLCKYDKREILTHGSTKFEAMKSVLYASKKYKGPRAPIHLTFDKSKWGPSFVPIQFYYLFSPFTYKLKGMNSFILDILIRHQNKKCLFPDRLVKAWFKDPENDKTHNFPPLQSLKEKFLKDKQLFMINESNMGQGILHFTSSLLHMSLISFRNILYKKACIREKISYEDHEDLLSSDDSYTIFCPELYKNDTAKHVMRKLTLFLRCQQIAEYLFNCRTSTSKSSINPLIGEFNSLFISNMSFIPTLIKYAISSVHPPNTDSFYRLVKESYGSSRQIIENGGGLDIYYLSQILNKNYAESIYHTGLGQHNDLSKLGIKLAPYHIGIYPLFNPALMVMFGPEYYNYRLYRNFWHMMSDQEKSLFMSSHKIIKGGLIETMAEFEEGDTVLGGLLRVEAKLGPIRQLIRIQNKCSIKKEDLEDLIIKDPLLIIREPRTNEEIRFKTAHKLYTTGSSEALKNIAASIYYGRVSATVSAKVFYIPNGEFQPKTYIECIQHLIAKESPIMNMDSQIKFLYPKHIDYDLFLSKESQNLNFVIRNPFEIQTIQTLVTHRVFTKLTQTVSDLLEYKWNGREIPELSENKVQRDFEIIKIHYPLIKDTLQETKEQFNVEERESVKSVLLLILKLFSLRERNFKGVIFGFGSGDVQNSFKTLIERNTTFSLSASISLAATERSLLPSDYDKVYQCYNHQILSTFSETKLSTNLWNICDEDSINVLLQDPGLNRNTKKRIFMSAVSNNFTSNVELWSGKVGIILHIWNIRQKYINGKYTGSFDIVLFSGKHRLNCFYNVRNNSISLSKTNCDDPSMLFDFFTELSEQCGFSIQNIIDKTRQGNWILDSNKILKVDGFGFEIRDTMIIQPISFHGCYLDVNEETTTLKTMEGTKIYAIDTGLLSSNYKIDDEFDFDVFGLKFSEIVSFGALNQNFSVMYKSRAEALSLLHNLQVPKPKITEVTKMRLKLQDWETRTEDKTEETYQIDDNTDFYDQLLEFDFHDFKIDMNFDYYMMGLEDALNFLVETDAIYSMKTTQRMHQSRKLFLRLQCLKYDLIAYQLVKDLKINKITMNSIKSLCSNGRRQLVEYSMISLYDRTFQTEGHKSPRGIYMEINQDFIDKFNFLLLSDSDSE